MAQDYASSILGVAVRVTKLDSAGAPVVGASASYIQKAFIRAAFTPEYDTGEEINQKNAAGELCVVYKAPDTLKQVNLELSVCNPDPEFMEITSGGLLLANGAISAGWAAPAIGTDGTPNGVSLEVWSQAIVNGKPAATLPYWRWVFPYVKLRPSGERAMENGLMANTFEGFGFGNAEWGDGPQGDWSYTSERPYAYARAASAPSTTGYETVIA